MNPVKMIWAIPIHLWGTFSCLIGFVPLAVCNFFQVPSLLILPFSRSVYNRYNTFIAGSIWGFWVWGIEKIQGTRFVIHGDAPQTGENAIILSNHQGFTDIVCLLKVAKSARSHGHLKWLVKDVLKYVPGIGWGMLFLDCIFLKRNWADDASTIKETFRRVREHNTPLWLVIFPEGTRYTPKKHARSQEFAKRLVQRNGQVKEAVDSPSAPFIPEHVLYPRTKGFNASLQGLREHLDSVYQVTIAYHKRPEEGAPILYKMIRGGVKQVEIHVRRTPVSDLPTDSKSVDQWLIKGFQESDRILADHYRALSQSEPRGG